MDEKGFVVICPSDGVVILNDEGVDPVQRSEVVEVGQQGVRSKCARIVDVDPSNVPEEVAFRHVRHEVESGNILEVPFQEDGFLCAIYGEDFVVFSSGQVQCLMDETPSRSKHRSTSQRTCSECLKVIIEHIHDMVDEFLR